MLFLLLVIAGCASSEIDTNTITITGQAVNRKGGPAIHSESNVYFIQNEPYWDDKYVDKQVAVTGTVTFVPNPEPEDGKLVQRMSASYYTIKKATWVLKE